ncbi:MAG: methyl-accepting chemotaxis protein [Spirochaetia bacterium]|jgi:methyl-accepting chemotaxis protein|nr:methyl-accepting chemotaxis protein [Spirochaetia bacterium]
MNSYKRILLDVMKEKTDVAVTVFMQQAVETDLSLELLKASMNSNYLRITRSVREVVESENFVRSTDNFQRLAESIGVDEIHITDGNGVLRWGNIEAFYGFDFHTSDQTLPFIYALTDPYFELAQEPQPRGADNVLFQYIGVAGKKTTGIIQIGVTPEELGVAAKNYDLQLAIKKFKVDNFGGYPFILSRDGIIRNHPSDTEIGKNVSDLVWGNAVINSENGNGNFTYNDDSGQHLVTFRYSGEEIYGSISNVDPYLAPFWLMMRFLMIIVIIVLVFLSIIMFVIVNFTTVRPLVKVKNMLGDISKGEGDLTKEIEVGSKDEIGELAGSFNEFLHKMKHIIGNIKSATKVTVEAKESLSATAEQTAAAVVEISANVNGVKNQFTTLDENIYSTSEATDQIQDVIANLGKQVENQSSAVEESTAAINEMVASLVNVAGITGNKKDATDKLVLITKSGGEKLTETTKLVDDVNSSISAISEMVNVINGIASQTNLLSMNAAIEAAHAGDAGKGFAVVADEIRKLAETSAGNAKGISKELTEIVNKIVAAASSSKATGSAFEEILKEVVAVSHALAEIDSSTLELSKGGEQILEAMQLLGNVTIEVQDGSSKMADGTGSIVKSMQLLTRVSSEALGSMDEISSGTEEISLALNELTNLTNSLDVASVSLESEVNKFKIEENK